MKDLEKTQANQQAIANRINLELRAAVLAQRQNLPTATEARLVGGYLKDAIDHLEKFKRFLDKDNYTNLKLAIDQAEREYFTT